MSDSISRQSAISAICNACGKIDCDKMDKCEKLQLPPANSSEFPNNSDTISRQAAIDICTSAIDLWSGQLGESALVAVRNKIAELPSALGMNLAEVGTDYISRQAALDAIMGQPPEPHYPSWYAAQIEKLPAAQPDRDVIDDCLRHIHKNISVHTATGGVIAIRYYMEKLYEEIYGEGKRPWWMT